ncbi:hypothetical protein [Streptomyces sp. S1D4-20]|uniref:hypothetical protein n=1 Tax=Streptomyces sp. S1D4-20 TaxID=2594462 RepID=UPI001F0755F2|nr:hypothetical protein [Streptomyces sp. S1D4-20]
MTVVFVALLWAAVKASLREGVAAEPSPEAEPEPAGVRTPDEEFRAVQAHNAAGRDALRRQIGEAAERALREGRGEW